MVTDQVEGVFEILLRRMEKLNVHPRDCEALFKSDGYQRLKKREAAMGCPFTDEEFLAFVLSDELLEKAGDLLEALDLWKTADVSKAAKRALAYLPDQAFITARIYPVIKPKTNSFGFELETDPAVFLYLNPESNVARFENILAHELHHVGFASIERAMQASNVWKSLPQFQRRALEWLSAFGEGLAMLAAAGGPEVHPHAASRAQDRKRWDADVKKFNEDLTRLDRFFNDLLSGRLRGEAAMTTGFDFFGVQGPWYTVGWQMAVLIEKYAGKKQVIESFCNPWQLFASYNQAAQRNFREPGPPLAMWSDTLVTGLAAGLPEKIIPTEIE